MAIACPAEPIQGGVGDIRALGGEPEGCGERVCSWGRIPFVGVHGRKSLWTEKPDR